ncbi:FIG011178: rRNA methylase [Richelia intracellularis HH01]|uniref:FIG011178: rRNA methylase n=1 Tax=Richelia intracellularis HH01 TaxID=1165094 RepID=M1WR78_9NOST|nr:RNA methyltransferase [Richelia intracellularis]CCH66779.1 FIG011178: rRNA methylase [Richelia intracellularis HH01]HAE06136.1 RNA methyltransferase [Richelia sp.]
MLTSTQNNLVKKIRKLHSTKERDKQGLFLIEGTHLIKEACDVGYPLVNVCCTIQWQKNNQVLWNDVCSRCNYADIVSQEVLNLIATTIRPNGIIATAVRRSDSINIPLNGIIIALEAIQDPGNLGTIIRTSVAAGAAGLWVSKDSVDLDNPKVLRASAGQWFHLPMTVIADLRKTVKQAQQAGIQVIASLPNANLIYWDVDWQQPSLILLGNEGAGLSPDLSAIADFQVNIPLYPRVESLNVGVAGSLMLYEALRQRSLQ